MSLKGWVLAKRRREIALTLDQARTLLGLAARAPGQTEHEQATLARFRERVLEVGR